MKASPPTIPSLRSPSPRPAPGPRSTSQSPSSPRGRRSLTTPSTPSMRVSISTPSGRVPSIASILETVPSTAPCTAPVSGNGLEHVWARIHEMEARRQTEHTELVTGLQGVRDLAEELRRPVRSGIVPTDYPAPPREGMTSLRRVTQRIASGRGRSAMLQR